MKAIVYTSNTGSTAHYAELLGNETGLSVYSTKAAKANLPTGTKIIYLGWLMAGGIKGYKQAMKRYTVCAVCAVGMGLSGSQLEEVRKNNSIPDSIPLFTLQGNLNVNKLHGIYKLMMSIMVKTVGKALADKKDRTPEENDMLDMIVYGGQRVSVKNLKSILDWYASGKG